MKSTYVKNLAQAGFYTYLSAAFRILTTLVLARILFPEEFGLIAMIQVFSGLILVLRDAGFSIAIIRGVSNLSHDELHITSLISGVFFAMMMFGLAFYLPIFYENPLIQTPAQVFSLVFILSAFTTIPQAILRKELKFEKLGRYTFLSEVVSSILCLCTAYLGMSYWSLVIRELFYYTILALMLRETVRIMPIDSFSNYLKRVKSLRNLLGQYGAIQLLEYGARNIDNLLIGKWLGDRDLGLYSRAYSLIYIAHTFILGIVNNVMLPTLQLEGNNAHRKFAGTFLLMSLVTGVANFLLIFFPEVVVVVLWGERWLELIPFIPYIGMAIFLQIPFGMFGNLFTSKNKDRSLLALTAIKFLILGVSISIGLMSGVLKLLQFYTAGFILYLFILMTFANKVIKMEKHYMSVFFVIALCGIGYFVFFTLIYSAATIITIFVMHLIYSTWMLYRMKNNKTTS